ncbi:MAG: hypothetical protein R2939_07615 [Kofleriaceae bacterium]
MNRRHLAAVIVVAATAIGSVAYAGLVFSPPNTINCLDGSGGQGSGFFTVSNTGSVSLDIVNAGPQGPGTCDGFAIDYLPSSLGSGGIGSGYVSINPADHTPTTCTFDIAATDPDAVVATYQLTITTINCAPPPIFILDPTSSQTITTAVGTTADVDLTVKNDGGGELAYTVEGLVEGGPWSLSACPDEACVVVGGTELTQRLTFAPTATTDSGAITLRYTTPGRDGPVEVGTLAVTGVATDEDPGPGPGPGPGPSDDEPTTTEQTSYYGCASSSRAGADLGLLVLVASVACIGRRRHGRAS